MASDASAGGRDRGPEAFTTAEGVSIRRGEPGSSDGPNYRDRDPPPTYSGEDPETTFRGFEKAVRLWEYETDVPRNKRGAKLLRSLTGVAKLALEEMEFDDIACEDGLRNVMQRLKDFFMPHLEVSLPRAFEHAVYGSHRTSKESFAEYLARMEKAFTRLSREGVELPDGAQGYILYRHASLNEHQDQRLLVWSEGRYDKSSMVKGLRKLDKVLKEKGKNAYMFEDEHQAFEAEEDNETDSEEYIYLADGDLDPVYEEKDVMAALASYKEAREALKNQKLSRGYFPPAKGRGKGRGKNKVHVEQLKLRTRCWKCNAIGHWGRECPQPDRSQSNGAPGSNVSTGGTSSSARSGFFVTMADAPGDGHHDFWLRQFAQQRESMVDNTTPLDSETASAYKGALGQSGFCGITTQCHEGVVDTAAEGGLIGSFAFDRLSHALFHRGLKPVWTPKQSSAKGVGGNAAVLGVALIPIGLGGVNGVLECTVIEGEVPLQLMKHLQVTLDFVKYVFFSALHGVKIPMREMPSGHVTIDVLQFHREGFSIPQELLRHGLTVDDFSEAMSAHSRAINSTRSTRCDLPCRASHWCHGVDAGSLAAAESRFSFAASAQGQVQEQDGSCGKGGTSKLEGAHGQGHHHVRVRAAPTHRAGVVPRFACCLAAAAFGGRGYFGGRVCEDHRPCQEIGQPQVQRTSQGVSQQLHSSETIPEGWGQPCQLLHRVQAMPQQVAEHIQVSRTSRQPQGRQEEGPLEQDSGVGRREDDRAQDTRAEDHSDEGQGRSRQDGDGSSNGVHAERDREPEVRTPPEGHPAASVGERSTESRGPGSQCSVDSNPLEDSAMPVSTTVGANDGEEGGTEERQILLQVRAERMRVLRMGEEGRCHVGGLLQPDRNHVPEVEEPEEGDGGYSRTHPGSVAGGLDAGIRGSNSLRQRRTMSFIQPDGVPGESESWLVAASRRAKKKLKNHLLNNDEDGFFMIDENYQAWNDQNQTWEKVYGKIDLRDPRPVRARAHLTCRKWQDDVEDVEKERALSRQMKKKLVPQLEKLMKERVSVSEVYSPPRICRTAEQNGLKPGSSFDILEGWDLRDPNQARAMWHTLQQEEPELVVVSPPCVAFSAMQNINFPKMSLKKVMVIVAEGLHHMRVAMKVACWQWRRGKFFLYEQPKTARSWSEEEVARVRRLPGVQVVECHMCRFNMRVHAKLNKKPTFIMTNCQPIAKRLDVQCDGSHEHDRLEGRSMTKQAQKYPEEFCQAIVEGLKEALSRVNAETYVQEEDDGVEEIEDGPEEPAEPQEGEMPEAPASGYEPTPEEKRAVMKLHKGVGHPSKEDLVRLMRAARVRGEIIRWAAKHFECEACKTQVKPKSVRPAAIPRTYTPCQVIGIDLIFLPEVGGGQAFPALSVVDWGSNYQMVERVTDKAPETIWRTLWSIWIRTFGLPEVVVCDSGKEFSQRFMRLPDPTASSPTRLRPGPRGNRGRRKDVEATLRTCLRRRGMRR